MPVDQKIERENDVKKIRDSDHPRKVVVAGPGTGKSHLFTEIIKKKRSEGKSSFLAITFIGKLGDALADDLCGLAQTTTMHGFARGFVLEQCKGWNYYPKMREIIAEDLKAEGITSYKIGDENYVRKTKEYQAVGEDDVVHYAIQICEKDPTKISKFDLILVDEYQDFNEIESRFVDVIASKNDIVIVGDDDQALYGFKGSSPTFIREKYAASNTEFESHTLRFCSRCTVVIIKYFHSLVAKFNLNDPAKNRIQKEYISYMPDKGGDSIANSKIHLFKNCPVGMIAYKIQEELEEISQTQKFKNVLIIGEGRSCEALLKSIAQQLRNYGFRNVDYRGDGDILPLQQRVIDAYKFLAVDPSSLLAWRILNNPAEDDREQHLKNAKTQKAIIKGTPSALEKIKDADILALEHEIEQWDSEETTEDDTNNRNKKIRRQLLVRELKRANLHLPRPLCNIEITACNILNSKGLGADLVFVVGFDQGRLPSKKDPTDSEIFQMLVAITRAKKRVYLINTVGKVVSTFSDCLDAEDVQIQVIN